MRRRRRAQRTRGEERASVVRTRTRRETQGVAWRGVPTGKASHAPKRYLIDFLRTKLRVTIQSSFPYPTLAFGGPLTARSRSSSPRFSLHFGAAFMHPSVYRRSGPDHNRNSSDFTLSPFVFQRGSTGQAGCVECPQLPSSIFLLPPSLLPSPPIPPTILRVPLVG